MNTELRERGAEMLDGRPLGTRALAALALCATATACTGASAAGVDVAAQQLTTSSQGGTTPSLPPPSDTTPPQLVSLSMHDDDTDGRVDRVRATFDEPIKPTTTHADWTLTAPPSGATKASLAVNGSAVDLVLTEGASAPDTAVRGFRVTLAEGAITDTAGNAASFNVRAPSDLARPLLVSVTRGAGTTNNGRPDPGDTIALTFTEPMAPSITGPITTRIYDKQASAGNQEGPDLLVIPGVTGSSVIGSSLEPGVNLNAPTIIVKNNAEIRFPASTVGYPGDRVLVTLGGSCESGNGNNNACPGGPATTGSFSFVPNPSLADPSGNLIATTSVTATHPIF